MWPTPSFHVRHAGPRDLSLGAKLSLPEHLLQASTRCLAFVCLVTPHDNCQRGIAGSISQTGRLMSNCSFHTNRNVILPVVKKICYNQPKKMYAAVCGGGWGRWAESRAFRLESWEESTISFHLLCSGSNSITLTSKKKNLFLPRCQNMSSFGNRI